MFSSTHPHTCRCSLHAQLAARRHESYRQLAKAILGPTAPHDDRALAQALAEHARLTVTAENISSLRRPRAA